MHYHNHNIIASASSMFIFKDMSIVIKKKSLPHVPKLLYLAARKTSGHISKQL